MYTTLCSEGELQSKGLLRIYYVVSCKNAITMTYNPLADNNFPFLFSPFFPLFFLFSFSFFHFLSLKILFQYFFQGKPFTSIEPTSAINDLCVFPDSGKLCPEKACKSFGHLAVLILLHSGCIHELVVMLNVIFAVTFFNSCNTYRRFHEDIFSLQVYCLWLQKLLKCLFTTYR